MARLTPGGALAAGAVLVVAKLGRRLVTTASPSWLDDVFSAVGVRWFDDAVRGPWLARGLDMVEWVLWLPEWLTVAAAGTVLAGAAWWAHTRRPWSRDRGREAPEGPELRPCRADPNPAAVRKDAFVVAGLTGLAVVAAIWLTGALPPRPLWIPLTVFVVVVPGFAAVAYGAYWGFVSVTGDLVSVDVHEEGVTLRSARRDRDIRWLEIRKIQAAGAEKPIRIRLSGVRWAVRIPPHGHDADTFRAVRRSLDEGLAWYRATRREAPGVRTSPV